MIDLERKGEKERERVGERERINYNLQCNLILTCQNFDQETSERPDVTGFVWQDWTSLRVVTINRRRGADRRWTRTPFASEILFRKKLKLRKLSISEGFI